MSKAVIVGSGHVGSCLALLLALEGVFDEVVLTDKRAARARAEAADMMAALPRLGARSLVRGGAVSDCADAQVAVITAAAPVKLGQTRNDMFVKNSAVVTDVVREIEATGFSGLYLMVTNPVDVLTYFLVDRLGIDASRVVGTGTLLDTMRLEDAMHAAYGADKQVRALALGEHGEGLAVDWSRTLVEGEPVPADEREGLRRTAIEAAYTIMKGKGSTSYGIAAAALAVLKAWKVGASEPLPLSAALDGTYGISGIALAVPVRFDAAGRPVVVEHDLDDETRSALITAAESMKAFYAEAGSDLQL